MPLAGAQAGKSTGPIPAKRNAIKMASELPSCGLRALRPIKAPTADMGRTQSGSVSSSSGCGASEMFSSAEPTKSSASKAGSVQQEEGNHNGQQQRMLLNGQGGEVFQRALIAHEDHMRLDIAQVAQHQRHHQAGRRTPYSAPPAPGRARKWTGRPCQRAAEPRPQPQSKASSSASCSTRSRPGRAAAAAAAAPYSAST